MGLLDRLKDGWKHDREIIRTLPFRQKLRFLADYYRWVLLLLLVLCLFGYYLGDMIWQSRQIIDLQGFFLNDRQNLFPAQTLTDEFSEYLDVPSGHRIAFEDSLYIDLDSSSSYHAASQGKLIAYIAARELDFFVAPEDLARYYAQSFLLYDLEELLPADLADYLREDFYYAEDGTGKEKACGLNLRRSRFLQDPVYDGAEQYFLLVLSYTPHTDDLIAFIRYAYDY